MALIICRGLAAALPVACIINLAAAQGTDEEQPNPLELALRSATVDLNVPDSPALAVLGVSGEKVIRPKTPRELAVSFTSGAFQNNDIRAGLALDTAPFLIFNADRISLGDYNENILTRQLTRTEVSVATAKVGQNDADGVAVAVGLRPTLWDRGDPYSLRSENGGVVGCFEDKLAPNFERLVKLQEDKGELLSDLAAQATPPRTLVEVIEAVEKYEDAEGAAAQEVALQELENLVGAQGLSKYQSWRNSWNNIEAEKDELAGDCRRSFRDGSWNASSFTVGLVPTWTSDDASYDDLSWSGLAAYATLAYGFEEIPALSDTTQLLLHARYRSDEIVPDDDVPDGSFKQDTLILAGQFRLALGRMLLGNDMSGADFNALAEIGYIKADRNRLDNDDFWRWAIGAEIGVFEDTYIQVSAGSDQGGDDDAAFVLGALKFGFSSTPTLSPPTQ